MVHRGLAYEARQESLPPKMRDKGYKDYKAKKLKRRKEK